MEEYKINALLYKNGGIISILLLVFLLKCLRIVARLEGLHNIAFPHDLTPRPGSATAEKLLFSQEWLRSMETVKIIILNLLVFKSTSLIFSYFANYYFRHDIKHIRLSMLNSTRDN
jgi:hypothetical protein